MADENVKEKGKMVSLGGLWKNKSKEGKAFLSGNIGKARLMVFPNSFKKDGSREPDYVVYVAQGNPPKGKTPKKDDDDGDVSF